MLDIKTAAMLLKKQFPERTIKVGVEYRDLYVFLAPDPNDTQEGESDPFFSVDRNLGDVSDFSILTDGDPAVLMNLFLEAQKESK